MTLTTCNVTGNLVLPDGSAQLNAIAVFALSSVEIDGEVVIPREVRSSLGAAGALDVDLWPNARGTGTTHYALTVDLYADTNASRKVDSIPQGLVAVPDTAGADIADILSPPGEAAVLPSILAGLIHAATLKATPAAADEIPLADSADSFGLKKTTFGAFATAAQGALAETAAQAADLGTAAAEDVGYFATAAQGTVADAVRAEIPTVTPAGGIEPFLFTSDKIVLGHVDVATGDVSLNGLRIALVGAGAPEFDVLSGPDEDGFRYSLLSVDAGRSRVRMLGGAVGIGTADTWSIEDGFGWLVSGIDAATHYWFGVQGPERLSVGEMTDEPQCGLPPGAISDLTHSGSYWQFRAEDGKGARQFLVHETGDEWAAAVLDTPVVEVMQSNGQSWRERMHLTLDLDAEDASGDTRYQVEHYDNREAMQLRPKRQHDGAGPWWSFTYPWRRPRSNGIAVSDFRRVKWSEGYTLGDVAAATSAELSRAWGLRRRALAVMESGWSGQTADKFLPEGESFEYGSGPTTVNAALVSTEAEYLWARDIRTRSEIEAFVADIYLGKRTVFDFMTWVQGPPGDPISGYYAAFLLKLREVIDDLGLTTSDGGKVHILIDQMAEQTNQIIMRPGAQEQLEWAIANASGRDWIAGPRYPHKIGFTTGEVADAGQIHHTANGTLGYGEVMGLAKASVMKWGTWQPLWIDPDDVEISGSTVTIETSSPRYASGGLVADTTTLSAAADHGFSLRDSGDSFSDLGIDAVVLSGTTITLTASTSLTGIDVEVGYAARGVAQPDGSNVAPQHSGCWGNVKMAGTQTGPLSQRPIDLWLCSYRKIHSA